MTQTAVALATDARTAIAEALNQSVAETAVATMLAQNFHWNVTGMAFGPLHDLFQKMYEDHFIAQDDLAERIKALDAHAEGTLAGMIKRSKVKEFEGKASDKEMIKVMQEPVLVFLDLLEQRFLRFGHRTTQAMALAFELADVDAGAWGLTHEIPRESDRAATAPRSWLGLELSY